jgi:hypothetical protein
VPEPILDCPGIMPSVGQSIAASMPQHVAVNRKVEAGAHANALDQSIGGIRCERAVPLGGKDLARVRELPLELAERPNLVPSERVNARLTVLCPPDMERCRSAELDLRPFRVAELGRPEPVPVGDEDQGRVPMAMAALAGGADESFDLGGGEILPRAQFAIGRTLGKLTPCSN